MKTVPLTQGKEALVDDEDYERVIAVRWYYQKHKSGGGYAVNCTWNGGKKIYVLLHRLILRVNDKERVDHRNRNKLDCQKTNLRIASSAENNRNRSPRAKASSKYKGVSRLGKKWLATICCNYKKQNLGVFATQEEAARAYNEAAKQLFGDFAYLNSME